MQQTKKVQNKILFLIVIFVILIFTLLFLFNFLYASPLEEKTENAITLDTSRQQYNLNPYVEVLEDYSRALSLSDVMSSEYSRQFVLHNDKRAPTYSYTDSAIWLRFQLKNPTRDTQDTQDSEWFLEVSYPLLDQIDFYFPDENGEYSHRQAGDSFPFHTRDIEHRYFLFNMPSSWDEEQPFYLRIKTQSAMVLPITLWETNNFISSAETNYLSLGIYYGIILIIIFYALFLYIFTRLKDYIYHIIFIISIGFFFLSYNGLAFQYLWPNNPWWAQNAINFFLFMGCASGFLFVSKILPVKVHSPFLHRLLKIIGIFSACMIPLTLVLNFTLAMKIAIATTLVGPFIILPATIICWKKQYRLAKYLFLGWTIFTLGILLMTARSLGVTQDSFITMYGAQIGFSVKIIFIFIGLADHMNILGKEKKNAEEKSEKLEIEKQQLLHAETLNTMLREISISDEIDHIAKKLLIYINKIIPYNHACFLAKENLDNRFYVLAQNSKYPFNNTEKPNNNSLMEKVFCDALKSRKALLIEDTKESNPLQTFSLQKETRSAIIIPIAYQKKHFGIVVLENTVANTYKKTDSQLAMNFAGQASLAIENAQLFQEINELAITDDLTKLYNRRYLFERGRQEFSRTRRYSTFMSLIIMDIDNFKNINDTFGHVIGDKVLQAIAQQCERNLRNIDLACRYGGEEYAFLLPETNLEGAQKVAERLREKVASISIPVSNQDTVTVTASFGVTTIEKNTRYFEEMVDKADKALYESKRSGKNIVMTSLNL